MYSKQNGLKQFYYLANYLCREVNQTKVEYYLNQNVITNMRENAFLIHTRIQNQFNLKTRFSLSYILNLY